MPIQPIINNANYAAPKFQIKITLYYFDIEQDPSTFYSRMSLHNSVRIVTEEKKRQLATS